MDANGFAECIRSIRRYRDKFVAHLDDEPVMHIPVLRTAQKAVVFYHTYVVSTEAEAADLIGLPDTIGRMEQGFQECSTEAESLLALYD